jgi:hypothetical protein
MFNLLDIVITTKNGNNVFIPWECLIEDEHIPMFLSMAEKYERQIERIKEKKGVMVIESKSEKRQKIDLTQIDFFKQVKRESYAV